MKNVFWLGLCLGAMVEETAFAQSSVTVYGIATAGTSYVDKVATPLNGSRSTGSRLGMDSGQYTQSRIGFRGDEDLGGGLKAAFVIEGGFTIDNGASVENKAFGRRTTIGLSGPFGTLEAGRRKDYLDLITGLYTTKDRMLPFVGRIHGNNLDRSTGERGNNLLYYTSPTIGGLEANIAYGFGESAGSISTGQSLGFGLNYTNGPLGAGFGYWQSKLGDVTASSNSSSDQGATSNAGCNTVGLGRAGDICVKTWTLGSSYQVGDVLLRGAYSQSKQPLITASVGTAPNFVTAFTGAIGSAAFTAGGINNNKVGTIDIGADYKIGSRWLLKGSVVQSRYNFIGASNTGRLTMLAVGVDYSLSKRTLLYGMAAHMRTSNMYSPGLTGAAGAPGADNAQNALLMGVMHSF